MDTARVEEGPWRATRLWNSIVRSLHDGIPLKKHRKHLKSYEDCFTANEAIEWLCRQLKKNPNFDGDVSKEQTVLLLQKLHRAGVIVRIEEDVSSSNSMLAKTPSALLGGAGDKFKAGNDLYRLAPKASSVLHTPGRKTESRQRRLTRSPLDDLSNTPVSREPIYAKSSADRNRAGGLSTGGIIRRSFRRIKNKHRDLLRGESSDDDDQDDVDENVAPNQVDASERQKLNLSYIQSLPANSLVVLDNDSMWREVFIGQLGSRLSKAHLAGLAPYINVSNIIFNMTKISEKGVVQLTKKSDNDLPRWTFAAMKCLANWPRPFNDGSGANFPNYNGFEEDVFNVVKEYFTSLTSPLTTFDLFDAFVSTLATAEAISTTAHQPPPPRPSVFSVTPMPYLETDLDLSRPSTISTTPTSGYFSGSGSTSRLITANERVANIRPTKHCMPRHSTAISLHQPPLGYANSTTSIMRNFLPPNTCFETAFMNENPITRIVPQKGTDVIHFASRPSSRMSYCRPPLSSAASTVIWDSRSIATQTSDEEGAPQNQDQNQIQNQEVKRQPRWKRSSRQRKSIAVMEPHSLEAGIRGQRFRSSSHSTLGHPQQPKLRGTSSMENFLDEEEKDFLNKYRQVQDNLPASQTSRRHSMVSLGPGKRLSPPSDNMILSKTVRAEKRKQREKRLEKSLDHLTSDFESPLSICHMPNARPYRHLDNGRSSLHICGANAPIPYMDEGMQFARAEPYHGSNDSLDAKGKSWAIETFQLLGLLLPPENRRKLQLLLKFMKRVRAKQGLRLGSNPRKSCQDIVLETFSEAILRPRNDLANYDEQLCKKIVCFFMDNFEMIWTPPVSLRKEVEERVYQSLVSKRIEAGEDPYPITFCQRVPSKVYEKERVDGVQAAMMDLLKQILADKKMSTREKRKRLKKFKAAYPEVYSQRFPTPADEPEFLRSNLTFSKLKTVMRI